MRCNDCNKFVSHELATDDYSLEFEAELGEISGTVSLTLTCNDCGGTLADCEVEANFTADDALAHIDEIKEAGGDVGEHTLKWEEGSVEPNDYYQTTDHNGKPIKSARYQPHMYQAQITGQVTCSCGEVFEVDFTSDAAQGSEFNPY